MRHRLLTRVSPQATPQHPKSGTLLKQEEGYSLTELMVVLVIIGILALIALPRFMSVTTKAKSTEAKVQLKQLHTLQMSHYFEFDRYGEELRTIRFEQQPLVTEGGNARYRLAIEEVGTGTYLATATSVVDFDQDGDYNVWEVDQDGTIRERTPD